MSKIENRLKRGENSCESFTEKDILSFKECLGDGNLWLCLFSFHWLRNHVFQTDDLIVDLIIFKYFGVVGEVLKETQALSSIGYELFAE